MTGSHASSPKARGKPTVQGKAWRSLLETHSALIARIEAEFRTHTPIELQQYDVMLHVSEAREGLRMTDLADAVLLTKSGLTSLVDRMEAAELVERRPDPQDRRATRIHLTPVGRDKLAIASEHHRKVVRRIWTMRMSEEEAAMIVDVLARVGAGLVEEEAEG